MITSQSSDANPFEIKSIITRRDFIALTGAAAGATVIRSSVALEKSGAQKLDPLPPGIKVSLQISSEAPDEDLQFAQQLGVNYVNIPTGGDKATRENFIHLKNKVEGARLKVWNIGNSNVHNMSEVTLNLPGRDEKIEEYKNFLRNLAAAGIFYTTYAHMGNGIWSSARESTRGGAPARAFNMEKNPKGYWAGKVFEGPLTHGRKYSKEELWENYTYFIKQVVPVAEELGMRIGIHPDDPPVPELGGIPRCIFGNFDGYMRALEIANSPNIGVCLCAGTWMEGGKQMGKDVFEAARAFAGMDKLWKIHFRNVSAPIPYFVESFVDNGYTDMRKLMRTLDEVDFRGVVIADHVPTMVGGPKVGWAYSIGYIKALLASVSA
ncbi:MAG TPA: mannonate dehydratase [Verrucomicrobiae bacterium]|jgi:mannonate dehydratase|nr:mannonate dehydratase [Verrucomicrobiae bacterium]